MLLWWVPSSCSAEFCMDGPIQWPQNCTHHWGRIGSMLAIGGNKHGGSEKLWKDDKFADQTGAEGKKYVEGWANEMTAIVALGQVIKREQGLLWTEENWQKRWQGRFFRSHAEMTSRSDGCYVTLLLHA